jgi:hypothetical protein
MDEVETVCGSCEAQIGVFYNCWARIGKGYISPIVDAGKELAVTAQGPLRLGEPLTLVHGWYVSAPEGARPYLYPRISDRAVVIVACRTLRVLDAVLF